MAEETNRRDLNWQLCLLFSLIFCWINYFDENLEGGVNWYQILWSVLEAKTFKLQMILLSWNMFIWSVGNPFFFSIFFHLFICSCIAFSEELPLRSSNLRCENSYIKRKLQYNFASIMIQIWENECSGSKYWEMIRKLLLSPRNEKLEDRQLI